MESKVPYTAGTAIPTAASTSFVDVRTQRGRLVFRLDAKRLLVEWREGREVELIDLAKYLNVE